MKTFDRTVIYNGKIIDLELHDVELPDGKLPREKLSSIMVLWQFALLLQKKKYYWLNNIVNLLKTLVRNSSR